VKTTLPFVEFSKGTTPCVQCWDWTAVKMSVVFEPAKSGRQLSVVERERERERD